MPCKWLCSFRYDTFYLTIQPKEFRFATVEMILQEMRRDGKYQKVSLCCVEGVNTAKRLYEKFGFRETVQNWCKITMELILRFYKKESFAMPRDWDTAKPFYILYSKYSAG